MVNKYAKTGSSKSGVIVSPAKPRLANELPAWTGDIDEVEDQRLELNECKLEGGDLSTITHLLADGSRIMRANLSAAQLEKYELVDVVMSKIDCIGLKTSDASWLRTDIADARMTGADFGAAHFEDCIFRGLKLDEAGFRFATFKRVRFEQCILRAADFSNATLQHVTFIDCDFQDTNFAGANCSSVDVCNQDLSHIKGVYGLKNATITNEQLIQLAPLLAAELNFKIND
jgi:uncharacterized protein YjbI with pentapeptide repeats